MMRKSLKPESTPQSPLKRSTRAPTMIGVGLIAQDVLIQDGMPTTPTAGGSCGNVLAFVSWLGWKSIPIGRLGEDTAGVIVRADLEKLGVMWDHVQHNESAETPVIIQEFVPSPEGQPVHHFRFACPTCRGWLPRYTPPTIQMAREAMSRIRPEADALYFDRPCPAAIEVGKQVMDRGGLVLFEPSGLGEPRLFQRAVAVSTIVKYSNEHRKKFGEILDTSPPLIEIETLGPLGLRMRSRRVAKGKTWRHFAAYPVFSLRDAAGAGDACTAGLLYSLAQMRNATGWSLSQANLARALNFGQSLASLNCAFLGARGLMRAVSASEAVRLAGDLLEHGDPPMLADAPAPIQGDSSVVSCNACVSVSPARSSFSSRSKHR